MSKKVQFKVQFKEVKKLENGNIAVRWNDDPEFHEVTDPEIATIILYMVINGEKKINQSLNSRLGHIQERK